MTRPFGLRSQAGVGIIEIMVAMAISLALLAGLVQIFVSQKQGFLVQQSQARLQENARLASMILSSNIAKAGFNPDPVAGFSGTAITGTNNASADAGDADDITIRFTSDGFMTDCLGTTVALDNTCTNQFRINGTEQLECVSTGCGSNLTQTLIDNVEDMQILYGQDTDGDGSVNRYISTPTVNALSVHIALLMTSEDDIKPAPGNNTYTLLDKTLTDHPSTPDQIQRRVIERVIALRNRIL